MTTQNITQLLSKEQKIQNLSKDAIKDLYTRQHLLEQIQNKLRHKKPNTPIDETKEFKQLLIEDNSQGIIYQCLRKHIDIQEYSKLQKADKSTEQAYFDKVTNDKFTEKEKIQIAKKKLKTTSECCGIPKAKLVHKNIEKWHELEK